MTNQPADYWRKRILRVHGSVLMLVTVSLTVVSAIGWQTGGGPWAILSGNDWAFIGFYQAYMLMFVIGVGLWVGSFQARPVVWDWMGIFAHLVPATILPTAWGTFARENLLLLPTGSIVFHTVFIGLELSAIFLVPRLVRYREPA